MLVGLALSSRRTGPVAAAAATLGTLVVLGLGYRTGQAGGDLVYRHGAAQAFAGSAAPPGYVSPTAQRQGGEDD
jgi:hypothetical protein